MDGMRVLSPKQLASIDEAIEHAKGALEIERELVRTTIRTLSALFEMKATRQISAENRSILQAHIAFSGGR